MKGNRDLAWIDSLTEDQVRVHLTERELDTRGILPTLRDRLRRYELHALEFASPLLATHPIPQTEESEPSGAAVLSPSEVAGRVDRAGLAHSPPYRAPQGERKQPDYFGLLNNEGHRPPPIFEPTRYQSPTNSRFTRATAADAYHMLRRWNLSFTGRRGSDAEAFLDRLREARDLITVSDLDLFKCLPGFLSEIALYWFRLENKNWRNWNDFEIAWRRRFGDPDYEYALRDEIARRTQGESEPVTEYITCLRALLERVRPPWPLAEQLDQVHRNMLPRLRRGVRRHEFRDFGELEEAALRFERDDNAEKNYRSPLPPEQSMFPELAYRGPRTKHKNVATAAMTRAVPNSARGKGGRAESSAAVKNEATGEPTAPPRETSAVASDLQCWNCGKVGHRSRDCGEQRQMHCYRCGKKGYTLRSCPGCSGNASRST